MPRRLRFGAGGYVYHVLNRAVGRATLFRKEADYAAFEKVPAQAPGFQPMQSLSSDGFDGNIPRPADSRSCTVMSWVVSWVE